MQIVNIIILLMVGFVFVFACAKKIDVIASFTEGAKDGLLTSVKLVFILVLIIVVVNVFRSSGLLDVMVGLISPLFKFISFPKEAIPLAIMRPISGGASLALYADILKKYGADTFVGRLCSVMTSSTETTLYTLAVYSGGSGVKRNRAVLPTALIADIISVITAFVIVNLFFNNTSV